MDAKPDQTTLIAWIVRLAIVGVMFLPVQFGEHLFTLALVVTMMPAFLQPMSSAAWRSTRILVLFAVAVFLAMELVEAIPWIT